MCLCYQKKNSGEKEDIKRAVRTLKREIQINEQRISKLNPIKDEKEIRKIQNIILKKNKQKQKLEKKIG